MNYITSQKVLQDVSFITYLKYLQYLLRPEYIKFLSYLGPTFQASELLQHERFHQDISSPDTVKRLAEGRVLASTGEKWDSGSIQFFMTTMINWSVLMGFARATVCRDGVNVQVGDSSGRRPLQDNSNPLPPPLRKLFGLTDLSVHGTMTQNRYGLLVELVCFDCGTSKKLTSTYYSC